MNQVIVMVLRKLGSKRGNVLGEFQVKSFRSSHVKHSFFLNFVIMISFIGEISKTLNEASPIDWFGRYGGPKFKKLEFDGNFVYFSVVVSFYLIS